MYEVQLTLLKFMGSSRRASNSHEKTVGNTKKKTEMVYQIFFYLYPSDNDNDKPSLGKPTQKYYINKKY